MRLAASLVVGITGTAALGVGAVHGARAVAAGSTDRQAARWQLDADYWRCLDVQAHDVIRPSEPVWIDNANFSIAVIVTKVIGPWATLVPKRRARAYVSLRTSSRDGCLGMQVVASSPRPGGGGAVVHAGSGASIPGRQQELPATPL